MDMPITEHPTRMSISQSVGCGAVGVAVDNDLCRHRVQQFASGEIVHIGYPYKDANDAVQWITATFKVWRW